MKVVQIRVIVLCLLLVFIAAKSPSQDSPDYTVTSGSESQIFVPQPRLGYVVKSSSNETAMALLESSLQEAHNEEVEYLKVANRPEMLVVLERQPLVQNEKNIAILSSQPSTEYIAPLYTLGGQMVAVIPEIIVRLKHETDIGKLEDLCRQLNCTIIRNLLYTEQEFLITPEARNAEEVFTTVEVFGSADFVEWAFPNLAFQPKPCGQPVSNGPDRIEPNDAYFKKQWHLDAIRAPEAWTYTTGDPNIVVAVLDYGVDINHPDLMNNIWTNPNEIPDNGIDDDKNGFEDDVHGWNFVNNNNNPIPNWHFDSPYGPHGTHCAGLIAAQGNNNLGVTGVTWNCTIMPIRVLPAYGDCSTLTELEDGLRYAATQGADVINNSWGMDADCPPIHDVIKDVTLSGGIGRNGKGCVVLFSTGNMGVSPTYPAKYPEVIAVGATDTNDVYWPYSNFGVELDIVAPSGDANVCSGNLWTTDPVGTTGCSMYNFTNRMGGTSGACPIVSGVAALILSVDPNLTNIEVRNILLRSAKDLGPSGLDEHYGFGRVDAYTAVCMANNPPDFVLFVDDNAPNDPGPCDSNFSDLLEDGSQEHPFDSIQEAINNSVHGDTVVVLPGIYSGNGNHDIDFMGRAITVRSKDGPESCIIDCKAKGRGFYFNGDEGTTLLDGFTIKNGYADYGGGIYNGGSPTITNCIFTENSAEREGGGIYNYSNKPIITNCIFTGNSASNGGGIYNGLSDLSIMNCVFNENEAYEGGGIYNGSSNLTIIDCSFTQNHADSGGGGMYNERSNLTITDCIFNRNSANSGGGMYNYICDSNVIRCTFNRNSALDGGGMCNHGRSEPNIINCTFTENIADIKGGSMYNSGYSRPTVNNGIFTKNLAKYGGGIYSDSNSNLTLTNCIIWGDRPDEIYDSDYIDSVTVVSFSDIQGGWPGVTNINTDPLFADPAHGDYHLKSQAGRWDPISGSWVIDDVTSPCIDAGDPNSPVGYEPQPNGGRINMGAYGGTDQASKSTSN